MTAKTRNKKRVTVKVSGRETKEGALCHRKHKFIYTGKVEIDTAACVEASYAKVRELYFYAIHRHTKVEEKLGNKLWVIIDEENPLYNVEGHTL